MKCFKDENNLDNMNCIYSRRKISLSLNTGGLRVSPDEPQRHFIKCKKYNFTFLTIKLKRYSKYYVITNAFNRSNCPRVQTHKGATFIPKSELCLNLTWLNHLLQFELCYKTWF